MKIVTRVLFRLAHIFCVVSATCYFPNGNTTNDAACNGAAPNSTCCGPGYACLSNNLCALTEQVNSDIVKMSPFYVRGGCTDKSWSSKDCPKFCTNSTNGDNLGIGGMGVGRCDGEGQVNRYYCRNSKTAELSDTVLCSNKAYYFEFSGFPSTVTIMGQIASQTSDSSSAGSTSSTSLASFTSSPSTGSSANDYGSNMERTLGLGLGLGLGLPLLGALGFLMFLFVSRHSNRSRIELDAVQTQSTIDHGVHSWSPRWSKHRAAGELDTITEHVSEVPATHETFELQGPHVTDLNSTYGVIVNQKRDAP